MTSLVGLVLNYCDPVRTAACVESLIAAGVLKVLVFDNSGPGKSQVVAPHSAAIGAAEVAIVLSDCNLGFAAGANSGLSECATRWPEHWVLLVNNDALVPVGLPERLTEALETDSSAASAFPAVRQQGVLTGWVWYQPSLGLITRKSLPGSIRFASGCCQLIVPERAGTRPFDEDFFMYGEDVALAWRLAQENFSQILVEGCEVIHEGSASSKNGSILYETWLVEGHLRLASKLSKGRLGRHILYLALRAVVLPLRALFRSTKLRSLRPIVGLLLGSIRAFQGPQHRPSWPGRPTP